MFTRSMASAAFCVALALACALATAQPVTPPPEPAPFQYPLVDETKSEDALSELGLGFRPDPYKPPTLAPGTDVLMKSILKSPPASLDWRSLGGVTSVKNQGQYGFCWIFGSFGDFESKVKIVEAPGTDPDYAEWDIVEGAAEGVDKDLGGNTQEVANHLSVYATITETDNPYQTYPTMPASTPIASYWSPPAGTPLKSMVEWHNLGDMDTLGQVTALKTIVQDVGPVTCSLRVDTVNIWSVGGSGPGVAFNSGGWDSDWVVPYLTTASDPDHCVLIVGWDDSKWWYGNTGQGAWLVKNSWSTAWGNGGNGSADAGYFWIAYGSARIGADAAVYPQDGFEDYKSANTLMYYDEFGATGSSGWTSQFTVYLCNLFTPVFTGTQYLTAVDFWAKYQNLSYEIKIYDQWNGTSSSPSSQMGSTVTGSVTNAGYYSIPLSSPIQLTSGDQICVHVKLVEPTNTWQYLVPYETEWPWFPNTASDETNKCYARYSTGFSWSHLSPTLGDLAVRGRYGPGEVWADFAWGGTESGTESQPFDSIAEAVNNVVPGGTVKIKGNTAQTYTPETPRITKAMRIEGANVSTTIRIGASS